MNSYERYRAVIQGEPFDFLPRLPILMQFAAEYIGSNYGAFASDYRVLTAANMRCAADFGVDQLSAISDPYRETHGFGAEIEFIKDGVPRCARPPLQDSKDLACLKRPDPYHSERMADRVHAVKSYHEQSDGQYSIMGWIEGPAAESADLRGVGEFLLDMIDDPSFARDLMSVCVDAGIEFARAQIEAGADTIGIGDAVASQVSPRIYENLIQPQEKRLVQAISAMGAWTRLHICGNITHLLPGISDLGVDIVDVDHPVSMKFARKALGDGVVLTGNIDPVSVLNGTPESIREFMIRIHDEIGNPYMVNAGCEIPAGTPFENLKALCRPIPCP